MTILCSRIWDSLNELVRKSELTMADPKYDVIVVGAGVGGLGCAALLAKRGFKTLLLEQNSQLGGRAMVLSRDGYTYEMWVIGLTPVRGHSLEALSKELGLGSELALIGPKNITMAYKGRSGSWNINPNCPAPAEAPPGSFIDPSGHFDMWGLDEKEQGLAMKLMTDIFLMSPEKLAELDAQDITFEEFLSSYEVPWALYNFLGLFANMAMVEPIDLASAVEYVRVFKDSFSDGGGGYPVGGFGHLVGVLERSFKANGGEIRLETRVEKIKVKDGQVRGVVTKDGGEFKAPIVVSDAGIHPTILKLVGEKHFDKSYVRYVKDLVCGFGITGQLYFLSKPAINWDLCMTYTDKSWWNLERYIKVKNGEVPDEVSFFGWVPSNYEPRIAPEGKQLLIAATMCPADPEDSNITALCHKTEEALFELWPEVESAIEAKEYYGPAQVSALTRDHVMPGGQGGECLGLGQVVGQCGSKKPFSETAVQGLFLVGVDAGADPEFNMGMHQSVNSAMKVARKVTQYHEMRQL